MASRCWRSIFNMSSHPFRILREIGHDQFEIQLANKRRLCVRFFQCEECQVTQPDTNFPKHSKPVGEGPRSEHSALCWQCIGAQQRRIESEMRDRAHRKWGALWAKHRAIEEAQNKLRAVELARAAADKRWLLLRAATPSWVDRAAIAAIYTEAREKSVADGLLYHVDHIWPVSHPQCCGLHVPWNLQVIPASENCARHNRLSAEGLTFLNS